MSNTHPRVTHDQRRLLHLSRALKHLLDARSRLLDAQWLSQAQQLGPLIDQLQEVVKQLWREEND